MHYREASHSSLSKAAQPMQPIDIRAPYRAMFPVARGCVDFLQHDTHRIVNRRLIIAPLLELIARVQEHAPGAATLLAEQDSACVGACARARSRHDARCLAARSRTLRGGSCKFAMLLFVGFGVHWHAKRRYDRMRSVCCTPRQACLDVQGVEC